MISAQKTGSPKKVGNNGTAKDWDSLREEYEQKRRSCHHLPEPWSKATAPAAEACAAAADLILDRSMALGPAACQQGNWLACERSAVPESLKRAACAHQVADACDFVGRKLLDQAKPDKGNIPDNGDLLARLRSASSGSAAGPVMKPQQSSTYVQMFRKACQLGSLNGCRSFIEYAFNNMPLDQVPNSDSDVAVLAEACKIPGSDACTILGNLYINAREAGTLFNPEKAAQFFADGCYNGLHDTADCHIAAGVYSSGTIPDFSAYRRNYPIVVDKIRALQLYVEACRRDDAEACNKAGVILWTGDGVKQDDAGAVAYYEQACLDSWSNSVLGCANLGDAYYSGRGCIRSIQSALKFWKLACERNNDGACQSYNKHSSEQ